jgi:hypothetical protein
MNHWAVSFLHVVPGLPWMLDLRKERELQQLASLVVALLAETLRLDTLEQSKVNSFFKENRAYVRFSFTWNLHGSHDVVVISVDIVVVYSLSWKKMSPSNTLCGSRIVFSLITIPHRMESLQPSTLAQHMVGLAVPLLMPIVAR